MSNFSPFSQSLEIELFLRRVLNIKHGSRDENILKDYYQSLVFYEEGHRYIGGPEKHKARINRLLRYFERAINKLSKKHPHIYYLKEKLSYIDSTQGILSLYHELRKTDESRY